MRSTVRGPVFFPSRMTVVALPYQCIGKSRARWPTLVVPVTVLRFVHIIL